MFPNGTRRPGQLATAARELRRGGLENITGSFAKGEIEILIATFAMMHSNGKVSDAQVEKKAENWLRQRSKSDERTFHALPGKAVRRAATDERLRLGSGATGLRSTSRPGSL